MLRVWHHWGHICSRGVDTQGHLISVQPGQITEMSALIQLRERTPARSHRLRRRGDLLRLSWTVHTCQTDVQLIAPLSEPLSPSSPGNLSIIGTTWRAATPERRRSLSPPSRPPPCLKCLPAQPQRVNEGYSCRPFILFKNSHTPTLPSVTLFYSRPPT